MSEHGERIVAIARQYIGTPYHHQARVPGVGIDCVGVLVCVARELGVIAQDADYGAYARNARDDELLRILDAHLERLPSPEMAEAGDVLTFVIGKWPHHVAIKTGPDTLLHSYMGIGRVVETQIGNNWQQRIIAAHRIPGGN